MEKDDKGSTMIRMGVSGWMFLLVPAYPGCPGSKAVKRSLFSHYLAWKIIQRPLKFSHYKTIQQALHNNTNTALPTVLTPIMETKNKNLPKYWKIREWHTTAWSICTTIINITYEFINSNIMTFIDQSLQIFCHMSATVKKVS